MNLKNKLLVLFLIVVIVNLTPAFATKMDQVANDAQDYNDESQKKMGFFKKIGFMVKGYKLIKEAKSVKDDTDNQDQVKSSGDKYDDMWNSNQLSLEDRKALLAFRNSNKAQVEKQGTNLSDNNQLSLKERKASLPFGNKDQTVKQETLPTNSTNSSNNTKDNITAKKSENSSFIIPENCQSDAEKLIQELQKQGITAEKNIQYEVTVSLKNKIVQLIDENGDIRYAYVENIDTKNSNSAVSLITNENKKIELSLDEFKKDYTGIVLTPESAFDPETLMSKVIGIQKSYIETGKSETQSLRDRAVRDALGWGIGGIGGGILLLVIGVIIAVYFCSQVVKSVQMELALHEKYITRITDPSKFIQWSASCTDAEAMFKAKVLIEGNTLAAFLFGMASLAEMGVTVIFQASGELVLNALAQNWVKVILGIIGIIIILCSFALIGVSTYYLIESVKKIIDSNLVLGSIDTTMGNLDKWINKGDPINDLPPNGNNTTTVNNQTIQNITNTENAPII